MTPNYDAAAIKATEILIQRQIKRTPIDPIPIIKSLPNVYLFSFEEIATLNGMDRQNVISMVGQANQEAATIVRRGEDGLAYIVAYNQYLPYVLVQRALARELAHIVLEHDGSRTVEARTEEALCFARHLLCPRPLLKAIESAGIPLTVELIGSLTGCRKRCLAGISATPGTHVPAALNQMVKEQFAPFVDNFINYANYVKSGDESPLADFGTFFDGYEE